MRIENAKGEDFIQEDIEPEIKRGRIKISDSIYKDFLKDILNRIKTSINTNNHYAMFTGGGSLILKDIITKIPNVEMHPSPIYSNVLCAENICRKAWR